MNTQQTTQQKIINGSKNILLSLIQMDEKILQKIKNLEESTQEDYSGVSFQISPLPETQHSFDYIEFLNSNSNNMENMNFCISKAREKVKGATLFEKVVDLIQYATTKSGGSTKDDIGALVIIASCISFISPLMIGIGQVDPDDANGKEWKKNAFEYAISLAKIGAVLGIVTAFINPKSVGRVSTLYPDVIDFAEKALKPTMSAKPDDNNQKIGGDERKINNQYLTGCITGALIVLIVLLILLLLFQTYSFVNRDILHNPNSCLSITPRF